MIISNKLFHLVFQLGGGGGGGFLSEGRGSHEGISFEGRWFQK